MALTKKDLQDIRKGLKGDFKDIKRHNDVLYEKFRNDIKVIGEGWQTVSDKVDVTFETVGGMLEKMTLMQENMNAMGRNMEIMKSDIAFIKQGL